LFIKKTARRKVAALSLVLVLVSLTQGCSTVRPVEMTPEALQQQIESTKLIEVGDSVEIVTADGQKYKFDVTKVDKEQVLGKDVAIPIKDIVALHTREFSGGKTALLVGTTAVSAWLILTALSLIGLMAGIFAA
jgi:hypothetical protein